MEILFQNEPTKSEIFFIIPKLKHVFKDFLKARGYRIIESDENTITLSQEDFDNFRYYIEMDRWMIYRNAFLDGVIKSGAPITKESLAALGFKEEVRNFWEGKKTAYVIEVPEIGLDDELELLIEKGNGKDPISWDISFYRCGSGFIQSVTLIHGVYRIDQVEYLLNFFTKIAV